MGKNLVICEKKDRILLITIDNPPVNALSQEVKLKLGDIFDSLYGPSDSLAVILTARGSKIFAAGADIKQMLGITPKKARERLKETREIFDRITMCPFPVICAVQGLALGAGCELALACDIRIAAKNARFGLPEVKLGLMPGAGGTQRLARLVGRGKAMEMIFSGMMIPAEEAWRIGLVERLAEEGEALNEALKLAEEICARGPVAVRFAKRAIRQGLNLPLDEGLNLEAKLWADLCDTYDMQEGVAAFIEKRPPKFKGD